MINKVLIVLCVGIVFVLGYWAYLDTQNKYSWIKSPLYNDERMEVGPLARMVVGFASNDELIKKYSGVFEISYELYKDKYWQSLERFSPN